MSKKLSNHACLLKTVTGLVGILFVSSLIPLSAFAQIDRDLKPYTTSNRTTIAPTAIDGVGSYLQQTAIPRSTVNSYFSEAYNSNGTFVDLRGITITPDGINIRSDGWISYPNGVIISPYGWVSHPNGTIISPNGWVSTLNGTVVSPAGEVITLGSNIIMPGTMTTTPSQ